LDQNNLQRTRWPNHHRGTSKSLALAVAVMSVVGFGLAGLATGAPAAVATATGILTDLGATMPGPLSSVAVTPHTLSDLRATEFGPRLAGAMPSNTGATKALASTPGCSSAPCPMGITDYGITPGLTTYTKSPKVVEAQMDVYGLSIGTANGGGCLDPDAVAYQCFTIQMNAVTHNQWVKNTDGSYWIQNVPELAYDSSCSSPCVSGAYSLTFLDNVWNFTSPSGVCPSDKSAGAGCINSHNIIGNKLGLCSATGGMPELYYCVGPTYYGLQPPFTVEAWTDVNDFVFGTGGCHAATGVGGHSCVNFWQGVLVRGVPVAGSGYYDSVEFLSGSHAAGTPTFYIADTLTPLSGGYLPYDLEWVMGGPAGGSNDAVDVVGDMTLETSTCTNANCSTYPSVVHAWSSGTNTAETISDVYMTPIFNSRQIGYLQYATDNPQTAVW
jgi:hypothetical protein